MFFLVDISHALGLYNRPLKDIVSIRSMIDSPGPMAVRTGELFEVAAIISALMNNHDTSDLGAGLYKTIEDRISNANIETNSKDDAYIGIRRISTGYKFYLCRNRNEQLASSNVYSNFESCSNGIISARNAARGNIEDTTGKNNNSKIKCPKFEIYSDMIGCYRFRLRSVNGMIVLVSNAYTQKQAALDDILLAKELLNTGEIRKE